MKDRMRLSYINSTQSYRDTEEKKNLCYLLCFPLAYSYLCSQIRNNIKKWSYQLILTGLW